MLEALVALAVKPTMTADFKKNLVMMRGVKEILYVTGEYDFLIRMEAQNTFELSRLIEELRGQEGVEKTVTFIVLEKLR
ncbi:MAG: hypothetical protein DSO07_05440 [Thermoproteota archaeon]|jgi:DNA-binding Lrp family transcriptional regulator|uniref:Lrp/AsnC family transcriptional regulator n=1 Tax=Candidatus Methanodesulfokora washburnensis TaxID=2478471 RepID=A0A429GC91_9CREN|nr:Lrp/AsnC ligand binding domain-containing protein [Candidatus Methanodesulfokores washburnensis]RSN71411.1 Lrp/AsnC family transcriptional regulator [Candidatus Methanodesulfokores washburnensis]RZN63531.1 MAG: Lrp/AsnC family transcriptional regulator [Candidatus Methanodesulfokores washburnensis]TDA41287.1 MAG: hypothetical protein DSO07_05440 [Candidatus Korarchaeota archaeon]